MPTRIPRRAAVAIIATLAILAAGGFAMSAAMGFGVSMESSVVGYGAMFRLRWCGNGKVEHRETCDDGNRKNGDGCSWRCQVEKRNLCMGHKIGETFKSPDGCNTCTCTANGAACTKMYCEPKSSSSSSKMASQGQKCLSSSQCRTGQYCTTEDGDCQSACEPGAEVCIQACAGVCRSTACRPIVCGDGTSHPSCTADGHPINYFADPCMNSRPPVCGDGICQDGEANVCPTCTNSDPPCMAPCRAGTCPEDCPQ